MALTTIKGNVLTVPHGIICHQVNCMGKMGAGIALSIRKKWPIVYQDYMRALANSQLVLGNVILSTIVPAQLYVASLCGQYRYGRDRQYTEYPAVRECLIKVNHLSLGMELPVFIPKGMGCSLAGGNWAHMLGMIEQLLQDVVIADYS